MLAIQSSVLATQRGGVASWRSVHAIQSSNAGIENTTSGICKNSENIPVFTSEKKFIFFQIYNTDRVDFSMLIVDETDASNPVSSTENKALFFWPGPYGS